MPAGGSLDPPYSCSNGSFIEYPKEPREPVAGHGCHREFHGIAEFYHADIISIFSPKSAIAPNSFAFSILMCLNSSLGIFCG